MASRAERNGRFLCLCVVSFCIVCRVYCRTARTFCRNDPLIPWMYIQRMRVVVCACAGVHGRFHRHWVRFCVLFNAK